jgi:hypothetical protein
VDSAASAETEWSCWLEEDGQPLGSDKAAQLPPGSLLLATMLSGSLWWGIIAGIRWIW